MKHGSIKEWYEKADKASVNHDQEWFKQCLQDKTKLCIWEYLRDISIKKLTNANTFSNSQCSQSNGLLMIMNLTTNKTSGWYYDISSNESRFITKIASYLHPLEECQVVERRDSIPLMSETTIHDTCCQKHRIRSKSIVPFALHNDLLAVCGVCTQSELWSYETYHNDLTRHIIMILRDILLILRDINIWSQYTPTLCRSIASASSQNSLC